MSERTFTPDDVAARLQEDRLQLLETAYSAFGVVPGEGGIHQGFLTGYALALEHIARRWNWRAMRGHPHD